jgi:N-acetyl-gamma-glutamyl-phosphate reductase
LPLLRSGLVDPTSLVIDAKSGTTGAGRKADLRLLYSEIYGDLLPYKIGRHQHWPEIVEYSREFGGVEIAPQFVTELLPVARGISLGLFAKWRSSASLKKLIDAYRGAYESQPDIAVGDDPSLLSMKSVVGTNRVHIYVGESYGQPVVFASIDNLLRGAAGQALMNANLLMGFEAHEGLI